MFSVKRASYVGTKKVSAQFILKARFLNLVKAANKLRLVTTRIGRRGRRRGRVADAGAGAGAGAAICHRARCSRRDCNRGGR